VLGRVNKNTNAIRRRSGWRKWWLHGPLVSEILTAP